MVFNVHIKLALDLDLYYLFFEVRAFPQILFCNDQCLKQRPMTIRQGWPHDQKTFSGKCKGSDLDKQHFHKEISSMNILLLSTLLVLIWQWQS